MSKKNLIAGQSGGPTAAINSSLYGVVSEALKHTEEIDSISDITAGKRRCIFLQRLYGFL